VIRLPRPAEPPEFDARVTAARAKLAKSVRERRKLEIDEVWGEFKPVFSRAQRGRCGFCELPVTAGQPGDVEHFAPKSDVRRFTGAPGEEGMQRPDSANLRGRRPALLSDLGYWWLAYDWGNYLLACRVCNSAWKGNLFPVREPPARVAPPTAASAGGEVPLLLNPFGRRDPAAHLQFNADGSVEPRKGSVFGRETIRTVGLHRANLVQERGYAVARAREAMGRAARAAQRGTPPARNRALRELWDLGKPAAYFPGAVRSVIVQELALSWHDLDELFGPA
jgi:hypothetical protein